jgi:hypothetical protein
MRVVELAGISYEIYRKWLEIGKNKKTHPVHYHFRKRIKEIIANNEQEALDIIRAAAKGGSRIVETSVLVGPKGTETRRTWKEQLPQWTAAAWYLERRHREDYGRDAIPEDQRKSAEEQAQEIRAAYDSLMQSVPVEDPLDELPEDMPT